MTEQLPNGKDFCSYHPSETAHPHVEGEREYNEDREW